MNFAEYISEISFRWLQPDMPMTEENLKVLQERVGTYHPDVLNTQIPYHEQEMRVNLYELCNFHRLSTFAIGAIINYGVSLMNPEHAYVNVGVWQGFTFFSGLISNIDKICVGIDNFSQFTEGGWPHAREPFYQKFNNYRSPKHAFYEMDYKDYFAKIHQGPIGFYVYDADHSYESQLNGLEVAEPFFAKDCIILVDDTNFDPPRKATLDFMEKHPGQYKMLLDRTTCSNSHVTFWNGILVIQKIA